MHESAIGPTSDIRSHKLPRIAVSGSWQLERWGKGDDAISLNCRAGLAGCRSAREKSRRGELMVPPEVAVNAANPLLDPQSRSFQ
jgi:hypothetical protein